MSLWTKGYPDEEGIYWVRWRVDPDEHFYQICLIELVTSYADSLAGEIVFLVMGDNTPHSRGLLPFHCVAYTPALPPPEEDE